MCCAEEKCGKGNIALIGFMGSGKSTVSAFLQEKMGMDAVDTDRMIVEREGMSIDRMFEQFGEEYFRSCESAVIAGIQNRTRTVISCGGGAVLRPINVENLKKAGCIVLLTASPETVLERVKDSDERPILKGNKNVPFIAALMEKRRDAYEAAADVVVNTDGKTVEEICNEIIANPLCSR